MKSDNFQAWLSSLVKPRDGACLNVMDAEAHARQAQHRNRYAGVSVAPMFKGSVARTQPWSECSVQQRFSAFVDHPSNASRFAKVPQSAY